MGNACKERCEQMELFTNNVSVYKKSNTLINSKGNVSLMGLKLFTIAIMNARYDEAVNMTYAVIGTGQLRSLLGNTGSSLYTNIRDQIENGHKNSGSLLDWRIIYEDKAKKEFIISTVITDAAFRKGKLTIYFNNNIKDYVINLTKDFTLLNCREQLSLNSHYSFRLYEIFKEKLNKGKYINTRNGVIDQNIIQWDVNITELKLILGIIDQKESVEIRKILLGGDINYNEIEVLSRQSGNKKYKTYASFKQNALVKAISEINEKTGIHVDFIERKSGLGGKVSTIEFYINTKDTKKPAAKESEEAITKEDGFKDITKDISDLTGLSEPESRKIAEAADYDFEKVKKAWGLPSRKNINNITGWMISAIKRNYDVTADKKPIRGNAQYDYMMHSDFNYDEEWLLDN
ncbi:MAG: replication initiation protein [Butyrivibrio sp.]|uniref:replication initiation protein n=1 Tax=Butyrivibrio sp. TaxID=28121 RepID=UPI0025E42BDF|nr:replication initiation protein [Butyrivibrio sp.]MCR5770558.1 replication initiation protein [Butyrivibrio sp.]